MGGVFIRVASTLLVLILPVYCWLLLQAKPVTGYELRDTSSGDTLRRYYDKLAQQQLLLQDTAPDKLTDRRTLIEWLAPGQTFQEDSSNGAKLNSQDISQSASELSKRGGGHLRDLCSRRLALCASNGNNNNNLSAQNQSSALRAPKGEVCGSDRRLYSSLCQLKWLSCLEPTRHLFRRPSSFCNYNTNASAHDNHVRLTSDATVETGKRARQASLVVPEESQGAQFIPLKGACDRAQYERMKWILWQDFNSSSQLLFTHLDANQNSFIEAHELWPSPALASSAEDGTRQQVYVLVREDPAGQGCAQDGPEDGPLESSSRCWIRLDPAFEPRYPPNPCSLSHLMLYELNESSSNFTRASFERVFRRMQWEGAPSIAAEPAALASNSSSVMKMTTPLVVRLGEWASLKCLPPVSWWLQGEISQHNGIASADYEQDLEKEEAATVACTWSRHGSDLAPNQGPHLSIVSVPHDTPAGQTPDSSIHNHARGSVLEVSDAQLYLSGQYKCACRRLMDSPNAPDAGLFEHWFNLQVSVEPVVQVVPRWQWSLPDSRASFECHYDYIDTGWRGKPARLAGGEISSSAGQPNDEVNTGQEGQFGLRVGWFRKDPKSYANKLESPIKGPAVSVAASKLTLENLTQADSGQYACRVERLDKGYNGTGTNWLSGSSEASLLVRDRPLKSGLQSDSMDEASQQQATHLWMFHEAGISIYRLHTDNGGQEIEVVREINGHSPVDARVDGNWNQLTLCGGLNPEQVVICEWSDNALHIDVTPTNNNQAEPHKYIYVGQPNLNRILVMDGLKIEIVAIVNTQPQPRKLFLYTPTRIHLSKWLRGRLREPKKHAHNHHRHHSVSSLASEYPATTSTSRLLDTGRPRRAPRQAAHEQAKRSQPAGTPNQSQPTLIQHDIWLLCYGQPLIVDPAGDEHPEENPGLFYPSLSSNSEAQSASNSASSQPNSAYKRASDPNVINTVQPFTPRLYSGSISSSLFSSQLVSAIWAHGGNKESPLVLRNRKSVHIIQSTFFPSQLKSVNREQHDFMQASNHSLLDDFKRSSLFTKHHIHHHHHHHHHYKQYDAPTQQSLKYLASRPQLDLIRDLYVQQKLHWLQREPKYKVHYAYVTHYDDRRLFRVSMDDYRYDSEIDLQHCDPINLIATAQGLLVVQCRSPNPPLEPSTTPLVGQLVLDQLTNARVQFNPNVHAQESYLSPDNRYLISIFTNSTAASSSGEASHSTRDRQTASKQQEIPGVTSGTKHQSVIFVQSVSVDGLKLEYEIKTSSLEITECSFVWKEGYYAAILVSTNRRDQQSEILSLRLADGRLELTARIPGMIGSDSSLHKSQLVIASRLQLAVVSTNQGTYVVDLVDNRVVQSLRHHQTPPTLLWV